MEIGVDIRGVMGALTPVGKGQRSGIAGELAAR